jgi:hypothetical protein
MSLREGTMSRVNRVVVALTAALALSAPTLAYAQRGGHGGGGGSHMGSSSGGRAPSSVGHVGSVAAPTAVPSTARNRTGQPIIGSAGQRMPGTGPGSVISPFFFPGGLGFGLGYGLGFSPFFGSAAFGFGYGPYGYDPFFYDPFGYGYYGLGYPGLGYGYPLAYGGLGYGYPGTADPNAYDDQYRRGAPPSEASHETGSIRLKVSPEAAQVYVDGTLAGTASDFDGLVGHHLVLEVGSHQLELRAEGHETFHDTIVVEANKTITERASLKKTK